MTAKSISRIAIALVAILAAGGIVFAIQYFHRGPPADASTAPATTTDAKPAAPNQKQAALASVQSATDALVSSLGGTSPLPPESNDGVPTFDVARVEPSGDAVIAGRAAPGATVELLRNGEPHDRAVADQSGQFVMVVPRLPSGTYDLTLRARQPDGKQVTSKQSVAVVLEPQATDRPVVALITPDKPTVVLSQPGSSAKPGAASAMVVEAVEVDAGGKFHVSGQARPNTAVRLYLNEALVASVTSGADGRFAVTINEGVRPGSYRVRLDEVEANSGKVSARAEVPFNVPDKSVTGSVAEAAAASKRSESAGPQLAAAGGTGVPGGSSSTVVVPKISTTTVSRGDSLWRLSQLTYGAGTRYAVIYKANKEQIRNPNMIYPGQIFVMPAK
jgi:nucleoid-associated protein YgaU